MATFRITNTEEGRVAVYTKNKPSKEQLEKIKGIILDSVLDSFDVSVELSNLHINIEDNENYFISVVDFNIYCDCKELEYDIDKIIRGIINRFNTDDLLDSLRLIDVFLEEMPLSIIDGEIEIIDYGYDKAEDEYFYHSIDR